jgi:hypothetical protein
MIYAVKRKMIKMKEEREENMVKVIVALFIAVALFAGRGYMEGGFIAALDNAIIISGIIAFAVGIIFSAIRFLHNHIDTYFITAIMLIRDPNIADKSVEEIGKSARKLQESIKIIRKVLH